MRLLILILLLPFIAQGQIVRTHPYYKPIASSCSYLLDQYSGAAAAYSLRKLDCDYAGSAIRVRRSSDNTEQDIGFVNGNLDTASLKTFVGTGGTDDGFVVTWYDQSGNNRNLTQSTAGNQAAIMDNGVIYRKNGLPTLFFSGSREDRYILSTSMGTVTANSTFAVFTSAYTGTTDQYGRIWSRTTFGQNDYNAYVPLLRLNTTENFGAYANSGDRAGIAINTTDLNIYSAIHTGSQIRNTLNNGTTQTYTNSHSRTIDIIATGSNAFAGTDGNITARISEIIWYISNKDSDASNIRSNQNTYYSVY